MQQILRFTINLGNISANDHFAVEYEAVVNYDAVDREVIKNKATIVGDNKNRYSSQSKVNIKSLVVKVLVMPSAFKFIKLTKVMNR